MLEKSSRISLFIMAAMIHYNNNHWKRCKMCTQIIKKHKCGLYKYIRALAGNQFLTCEQIYSTYLKRISRILVLDLY